MYEKKSIAILIRYIFLSFLVLVFFRTFAFQQISKLPINFNYMFTESMIYLCIFLYLIYFFQKRFINREKFNILIIFSISLALIPIYSSVLACITFKQDMLLGILAERNWFFQFMGFFIFSLLYKKSFRFVQVTNVLITLSFVLFFIYITLIILNFHFSNVSNNVQVPVILKEIFSDNWFFEKRMRYKFDVTIFVFVLIYFSQVLNRSFNQKYLFFGLILFLYILIFHQGRGLIFSLLIVFFISYFNTRSNWKFSDVCKVLSIVGLIFIIFIISTHHFKIKRYDLVSIVSNYNKNKKNIMTSNLRYNQIIKCIKFISEKPTQRILLGSGKLSQRISFNSNEDDHKRRGFRRIFGYFYPSDIGILGSIFLYGVMGFLYINLMYLFVFRFKISEKYREEIIFLESIKYFILFVFIYSFQTAMTFFNPERVIVPLFILYYTSKEYNDTDYVMNEMWIEKIINRIIYGNKKTVPMKAALEECDNMGLIE